MPGMLFYGLLFPSLGIHLITNWTNPRSSTHISPMLLMSISTIFISSILSLTLLTHLTHSYLLSPHLIFHNVIRHNFCSSFWSIFDPTFSLSFTDTFFSSYNYLLMFHHIHDNMTKIQLDWYWVWDYLLPTSAVRPPHDHLATSYLKQSISLLTTQFCVGTSSAILSTSH